MVNIAMPGKGVNQVISAWLRETPIAGTVDRVVRIFDEDTSILLRYPRGVFFDRTLASPKDLKRFD